MRASGQVNKARKMHSLRDSALMHGVKSCPWVQIPSDVVGTLNWLCLADDSSCISSLKQMRAFMLSSTLLDHCISPLYFPHAHTQTNQLDHPLPPKTGFSAFHNGRLWLTFNWRTSKARHCHQGCTIGAHGNGICIIVPWYVQNVQSDCSIPGDYISYPPPRRWISKPSNQN